MFRLIGFLFKAAVFCGFVYLMMYFFGSRVPREQTSIVGVVIHAPQAKVWDVLNDPKAQIKWRSGLRRVTAMPPRDGRPCWLETTTKNVAFCETAAAPPRSRSVETTYSEQIYTGTWTYKLEALDDHNTEVTVTETNTIKSPLWRFVGHYIARQDTVIGKSYLDGLKRAAEER